MDVSNEMNEQVVRSTQLVHGRWYFNERVPRQFVPIPANAQIFIDRKGERFAMERSVPNGNSTVLIELVEVNGSLWVRLDARISKFSSRTI